MKRLFLAIVAVLLAAPALFVSAAEACISCEYKPEVLNARPAAKTYESRGSSSVYERVQIYKKRAAGSVRASRKAAPARVESARASPSRKPSEREAKSSEPETSTDKSTESETAAREAAVPDEKSASDTSKESPKVAEKAGCRKYFPNIGMTVAVPCE